MSQQNHSTSGEFNKKIFNAVASKDYDKLMILIKTNLQEAVEYRSKNNITLLHWAVTNSQIDVAKLLVNNGIDVSVVDEFGKTAASLVHINHPKAFKDLLNVDVKALIEQNNAVRCVYDKKYESED